MLVITVSKAKDRAKMMLKSNKVTKADKKWLLFELNIIDDGILLYESTGDPDCKSAVSLGICEECDRINNFYNKVFMLKGAK